MTNKRILKIRAIEFINYNTTCLLDLMYLKLKTLSSQLHRLTNTQHEQHIHLLMRKKNHIHINKSLWMLTGNLLAAVNSVTPFSASSKNFLALWICFFIKILHLSVTLPANMSSSDRPACANSSWGKYTLPLLALQGKQHIRKTEALGAKMALSKKEKGKDIDRGSLVSKADIIFLTLWWNKDGKRRISSSLTTN